MQMPFRELTEGEEDRAIEHPASFAAIIGLSVRHAVHPKRFQNN